MLNGNVQSSEQIEKLVEPVTVRNINSSSGQFVDDILVNQEVPTAPNEVEQDSISVEDVVLESQSLNASDAEQVQRPHRNRILSTRLKDYVYEIYLFKFHNRDRNVLHKYANEDVSLGSWFLGLDVEHIDDRRLCCGTPPDCEWKAQAGNICVASFDWSCSGICNSADRIKEVHRRCGEGEHTLWNATF
ncbi:hypothetical protein RD792_002507 [Penstemon davidsonii]|uniref:Hexosyltransferase n=1 Tax=Penstemon davidsonii TaxID=160366 RepID=A0ABR0DR63_9LAMI|nr:hypothetical protein RD792_002507 [Penstemon davidsonii]